MVSSATLFCPTFLVFPLLRVPHIHMFHVFALAYLTTIFLWPTILFFHCFVSHERERVHCTTAHMRRKYVCIQVSSDNLQIHEVKRDMKHLPLPRRVTGIILHFNCFSISPMSFIHVLSLYFFVFNFFNSSYSTYPSLHFHLCGLYLWCLFIS